MGIVVKMQSRGVRLVSQLISRRTIGSCCAQGYFAETEHGDRAFAVRTVNLKYGQVLEEVGDDAYDLLDGNTKGTVVIMTDRNLRRSVHFDLVESSLKKHFQVRVFDDVRIEPTDHSFMEAARWMADCKPTLCVSLGGGSVMDTAKAALLYSTFPPPNNDFFHYVNKPVGTGAQVPKRGLPPHIAIPTTSGTGSECTGFAICKISEHPTAALSKTGIASESLCPTMALVDPRVTLTMPQNVVASSGFDVLSHAIESYTARPYSRREPSNPRHRRPLNQGANPHSDFGCIETIRLCGEYFERALADPEDWEAREKMLWASTLVGVAMGNCGVAIPHGLSYPVCGHVKSFTPSSGYPTDSPLVPHGMGVSLCAPAAVRVTNKGCPDRHLHAAKLLKAENAEQGSLDDAGEILAQEIIRLLKVAKFPNGIGALGYTQADYDQLATACFQQKRVINNAPVEITQDQILEMYKD